MRYAVLLAIVACFSLPARADSEQLNILVSKYSVKETLDRLSADLTSKGIRVVARVNHAAAAKAAGMELPPTELLVFGNPKLGTPLMQADRLIGLDLPMKVLAWRDEKGTVQVAYTKPAALRSRYNISGKDGVFDKMTAALAGLTAKAAGAK